MLNYAKLMNILKKHGVNPAVKLETPAKIVDEGVLKSVNDANIFVSQIVAITINPQKPGHKTSITLHTPDPKNKIEMGEF